MSEAVTKEEAADIVEELLQKLGAKPVFRAVAPYKKGVHAMWVNAHADRQTLQIDLLHMGETAAQFRKRARALLKDAHKKRAFHLGGG